jgi:hypothetical protein
LIHNISSTEKATLNAEIPFASSEVTMPMRNTRHSVALNMWIHSLEGLDDYRNIGSLEAETMHRRGESYLSTSGINGVRTNGVRRTS